MRHEDGRRKSVKKLSGERTANAVSTIARPDSILIALFAMDCLLIYLFTATGTVPSIISLQKMVLVPAAEPTKMHNYQVYVFIISVSKRHEYCRFHLHCSDLLSGRTDEQKDGGGAASAGREVHGVPEDA